MGGAPGQGMHLRNPSGCSDVEQRQGLFSEAAILAYSEHTGTSARKCSDSASMESVV